VSGVGLSGGVGCVWSVFLCSSLRSNIPRSALYATLDTYDLVLFQNKSKHIYSVEVTQEELPPPLLIDFKLVLMEGRAGTNI
jgi:hypothetical protein